MYSVTRRALGRVPSLRYASRLSTALHRGAPIDIHAEVQDALATGIPVVALETALTTHGLPPPINLQVTRDLEAVVRSTGCIPATIGVVAGRVKIGLQNSDLERLADVNRNPRSVKISRRDIAPAIALKADGGTSTALARTFRYMVLRRHYHFLGGVHRGAETSMDISADLHELTRCPVGLVSAGIKSILDIGRTLEYLETLGVPVIPYSNTRDFPAFFSPRSGFQSPWNVNDPAVAARMLYSQWQLGMENGALIAVPIPEEYAKEGEAIQQAVNQAVLESDENGMSKRGKDVTPWLLARVAELTKDESIDSNIALLKNTALIGLVLCVEGSNIPAHVPAKVVVVGSAALDISAQTKAMISGVGLHSTSPGTVTMGLGGVARNIAEACHRVGTPALLIAGVGSDSWGRILSDETKAIGMRTDGFMESKGTAVCSLFLDGSGNLVGGVADMDITEKLDVGLILREISRNMPEVVALDGNLSSQTIQEIVDHCVDQKIPVLFEPTSITKSERILPALEQSMKKGFDAAVSFFTPNLLELRHIHAKAREDSGLTSSPLWWSVVDKLALGDAFRLDMAQLARRGICDDTTTGQTLAFLVEEGIAQMAIALTPFFRLMFIKCGDRGVVGVIRLSGKDAQTSEWARERSNPGRRYVVAHADAGNEILVVMHFPPHPTTVVNSTGAGDSFVGALLASLQAHPLSLSNPTTLNTLIDTCQKAACLTLQTQSSVSPLLNTLAKY
ncbi:Indigoidine synthase A like protein-domain-containing protein [Mycena polygramma]|nr:Indigoidine synthase A like protein-domain-containing protein [Mycena polygramma]